MTTMVSRRQYARAKKLIAIRYNKMIQKHNTRMDNHTSRLRKRFPSLSLSSLSEMSSWTSDLSFGDDSLDFSLDSWSFSLDSWDLSLDISGLSDDWREFLGQDWLERPVLGSNSSTPGLFTTGLSVLVPKPISVGHQALGYGGDEEFNMLDDTRPGLIGGSKDQEGQIGQIEIARDSGYVFCDSHIKMRIRVQTLPPLPDLKAWFVPRPTGAILTVKTVSDLKKILCHDIKPLSQEGHSFKTIRLLLEGFELLDDLPFEEVLRDGDLICIQVSQEATARSEDRKRKRRDTLDAVPTKKRRKSLCTKNHNKNADCDEAFTSSDSSSVVSRSTTSESEDESETSDSDSSSNESSSESSDESADVSSTSSNSSQRSSLSPEPTSQPKRPAISPVPPGLGKPSTHSRNRRRRLKRQHQKEAKETQNAPPRGISDANITPLGGTVSENPSKGTKSDNGAETGLSKTQSASSESRDDSSPLALDNSNGDIMMMSLRNKNKKKNFRQTMAPPTVRKIVFDDKGNAQSESTVTPAPTAASTLRAERTKTAQEDEIADTPTSLPSRILPPSELAAAGLLPSNMFVTSVEFGRQPKKKKKQTLRNTHEEEQVSHELRVSRAYEDEDQSIFEDANIDLPYGDEEESGNNNGVGEPQFDWKMAESNWERFSPVDSLDQLRSGVLVCWQCLAINPQTFTPENMLSVGRVENVAAETVTIQRLLRSGTEIAAAFGIGEENGADGAEEYSSEDVSGLGWRVVELA